ncbi:hypothetical protein M378DRAFT_18929 [Amanita muscaria Koide BX008]|uniref:Uncharacterized protein n=1 Tax=Amanita muscaria (strain Koide BX008) TaxID=946122 RepID=A0A0C2VZW9_AMAMK|nr:hypothetical protein M378DRAFT_18929 [Amanita muscaria Koide BX008]
MSSRRVIRRHQPLITLRIPFEVQPLPPPPTITLRKNFQSTLMNSNHRIKLPFIVPMPIASNSSPAKSSHTGNHAAQRSKWQQTGWLHDADNDESDLSDSDSLSGTPELPQASTLVTPKIPKPPGEAGQWRF